MNHNELLSLHEARLLPDEAGYQALRESAAWRIQEAAVLRISGADRRDWLQGQLTNDAIALRPGEHFRCCVLTATGQIIADCLLFAEDNWDWLIADGPVRNNLIKRLEMTIILEDVAIEDHSSETLIHVAGPKAIGAVPNARLRSGGYDILDGVPPEMPSVGNETWERARLEDGYPLWGQDMNERTLAMEMGPRFVQSRISFTKGCYTGQEIVERISARGHTNRQWAILKTDSALQVGDEIVGGGVVTSAAGTIAAGFVKKEHLEAGSAEVQTTDGVVRATVSEV